ncbi:hypothetical protein IE81DRAFT_368843 [Ceraceosorus guamensis]|uniref:Rhodanese domain-containing protein n=1 Tax=Ceraceosorus guamensis TaxID=1522189 RepID=A0A316VTI6_9BASI|nr:hypothetical protein IE81DRAFT_368843 [Ceraceosorus guamensis]PWN39743.1 hypothetical protein IE81DRAFT_368843 [Ceraceosorus guamensis]
MRQLGMARWAEDWPVILDLRPVEAFCAAHILRSNHIGGLAELEHRFSSLPPPPIVRASPNGADGHAAAAAAAAAASPSSERVQVPPIRLIVAKKRDWIIQHKFDKWHVHGWRWIVGPEECELPSQRLVVRNANADSHADATAAPFDKSCGSASALRDLIESLRNDTANDEQQEGALEFWRLAAHLGLLTSTSADVQGDREAFNTIPRDARHRHDMPALMFQPSPVVERAMLAFADGDSVRIGESDRDEATVARALDLGCGGARDVAWVCEYASRVLTPGVIWRIVGVDSLRKALLRAEMLLRDAGFAPARGILDGPTSLIDHASSSFAGATGVDALVWARIAEQKIRAVRREESEQASPQALDMAGTPPMGTFDLILLVRFLPPIDFLLGLHGWINVRGVLAISHFALLSSEEKQRLKTNSESVISEHLRSGPGAEDEWRKNGLRRAIFSCGRFEPSLWSTYTSPPTSARFSVDHLQLILRAWNRWSNDSAMAHNLDNAAKRCPPFELVEHRIEETEDGRPLRSVIIRRNR